MTSTDWDQRYRSGDTPWCKGQAHPALPAVLDYVCPQDFSGHIVVPGCGRASDVQEIAAIRPGARVSGIDISSAAIAEAGRNVSGHPRIALECGDFLDASWRGDFLARHGTAAIIWEHTCFCALPPGLRDDYVAAAAAMLVPGGWLAGVFFLALDDDGEGPPWNCPPDVLASHFSGHFAMEPPGMVRETFPGRDGEERAVWMRRAGTL
jgi:SAM-dependent methyltransferase